MGKTEKKIEENGLPSTARSLPISLIRARESVMLPIREMLHDTTLTEQQWRVLRVLAEYGPIDATKLSDKAGLLAPSVTRIVQTMIRKGHISRQADPADRRRQVISLEPEGQALLDSKRPEAQEIARDFRRVLGDDDYEQLLDLLDKLIGSRLRKE